MEEAEKTIETIQRNYAFPGVIRAIDGTHIKITAPKYYSYVNRKGYNLILQVNFIYINYMLYFV